MKSTALACALAAAALAVGSLAQAQGWERGGSEHEGRGRGAEQGRRGPPPEGRQWQRGQQPPPRQPQVQVQPPPRGQWQRHDGGAAPPQYPPQGPYPRYAVPPQGYVQPAPPQAHYGPPGRPNGAIQAQPQWPNPQWGNPQWQHQPPPDGRSAERGAWRQAPRFRRGDYLPPEYRHHYVQDWRAHRLYAPPPGYQWVQVDTGDYLLIAIGTGVIANLLLGQ